MLIKSIVQGLLSVFLDDLGLGLVQELILFLTLRFLLNLTDFRMGVIDWSQFHILFKNLIYYK